MSLPNVLNTGRSGMVAARTQIATTGHNIANASTEGYSRQKVNQATERPHEAVGSKAMVGRGVKIDRIDRVNDQYIEKQIRNAHRDVSYLEEKDVVLSQTEDIFNEMNGEGLNRLMSKFFNEFRKLSNEPDNEAVRQAVRESASAIVSDFRRLKNGVADVRKHIDARLEGHVKEVNSKATDLRDLNERIQLAELGGGVPNDLYDKRDKILRGLSSLLDISVHTDNQSRLHVDVRNMGPLVIGPNIEKFAVQSSPKDGRGKAEGAFDVVTGEGGGFNATYKIKAGKLGALLTARDETISQVESRLDELAFNLSEAVNDVHRQGFTRSGFTGVDFFKKLNTQDGAAERLDLSDAVRQSADHVAAAASPDSPGDNRIALAISGLQNVRMLNGGKTTVDDFYNSIVSDVGVVTSRNKSGINQQKDIMTQLNKMHDQVSGVSIDEETANLMQFQHSFDASAKVIQVADEMLKTVLDLKR